MEQIGGPELEQAADPELNSTTSTTNIGSLARLACEKCGVLNYALSQGLCEVCYIPFCINTCFSCQLKFLIYRDEQLSHHICDTCYVNIHLDNLNSRMQGFHTDDCEDKNHLSHIKGKTEKDDNYPKLLKEADDNPVLLFAKGNLDLLMHKRPIAVVGTRKITGYGRQVTTKIVQDLVRQGCQIVSGFMYGVDTQAHQVSEDLKAFQDQDISHPGFP